MRLFCLLLACCLSTSQTVEAQPKLSDSQWRDDLRFLQQTVHTDYSFLFKKVTAQQFDNEVEKLYEAIPTMKEHEIVIGLARIVSLVGYGHTELDFGSRSGDSLISFQRAPFNLDYFQDGVYIEGVHQDYAEALGAKVLEVEGQPVADALAAIRPVLPVENEQFFKAHGPNVLSCPQILHAQRVTSDLKDTVTLTLQHDGGEPFEQVFAADSNSHHPRQYGFVQSTGDWRSARDSSTTPAYLKHLERMYYYEYLPKHKAVYVRHSQIQDDPEEDIPTFYKRLFEFIEANAVDRFVLDLRLNGGGNNYKNKPIVIGIIGCQKINRPGHLFVIIGRRTYSACQNLVNELDNYTEAIFVGEPTAENINFYGDNRRIELPNSKIPVRLSFAWWQDKPQWENGPWTAPHVAVEMTFDDYRANRDPVLETALNLTDEAFITDPMAYLTGLFTAGDLDEVRAKARALVGDPRYRYLNVEDRFNRAAYNLLAGDDIQLALCLFQLNTELFPDSANTWDSLGEAHWKAHQTDKAIAYYNKAIALDPDGPVGENARTMLKRIHNGESR